jgi:signal transduction histidine kinase
MPLRLQSLTTRLALANGAALVALLAASSAWLLHAERVERRRETEERVLRFGRQAAFPLTEAWRAGDLPRRARSIAAFEPAVERLRLMASDGAVLYDSRPGAEPAGVLIPALQEALRTGEERLSGGDPGLVLVPVRAEGDEAVLVFSLSSVEVDAHVQWALVTISGVGMLAAAVGGVIGYLFARRLTGRLDALSQAARRIADGHFDEPLDARGGDEFGALAERMNEMASRLQENISQLEDSNRQLARANRELTEVDQLKSDLIANVSHELRTPLTAIRGYTDYMIELKLGAISPGQEKGLQVVQRNLDRLSRTVNALLDYSHLEAGRLSLNRQPFSLPLLVEQVYQTLRSMIEKKGLSFVAALSLELPEVDADREKLSQVFENLIINAVKFTPEGGSIQVAGDLEDEAVRVSVRDSGIGIAAEQVSRIFTRFHQVDGSSRRAFGGVGLGLAIVKSILDAHDVEVEVESRPGGGTTFSFSLPLAPPAGGADPGLLAGPSP